MRTTGTLQVSLIVGLLLGLFLILSPSLAFTQEAYGVLTVVKGDVQIKHGKTKAIEKARIGSKVVQSDTVITGKDARAKIVMSDNNVINVSPETQLELEKYVFNPQKDEKSVMLNLMYGKVRSTVKQKYDGKDDKFMVKTPSAVAGVRGTDFLMGFNTQTQTSQVITFSGLVDVGRGFDATGNLTSAVSVKPGQITQASAGTPPAPPVNMPKEQLTNLDNSSNTDHSVAYENSPDMGAASERAPAKEEHQDGKGGDTPHGEPGMDHGGGMESPQGEESSPRGPSSMLPPPPPPNAMMGGPGMPAPDANLGVWNDPGMQMQLPNFNYIPPGAETVIQNGRTNLSIQVTY